MQTPDLQNISRFMPGLLLKTAAVSAIALSALSAQAIEVTGGFTGWWGQPDQQNHGLIVSISRLPSGEKTGVLYWAHFDEDGEASWLFAQGDIDDSMIEADVFAFEGITFMQGQEANANFGEQVGTMEVVFSDCLNGDVQFDTETVGAGSFRIKRLTNQPGAVCSGGISDDMRPGDRPQRFEIDLVPPDGAGSDASGNAEFDLNPGRGDFEVEIENVAAGEYVLEVGGEPRGTIVVDEGESEGEIEFRSPVTPGKELLDFDPRDKIIEVLLDDAVVLTGLAPAEGDAPGNGPPEGKPNPGRLEIEIDLTNEGVFPEGEASAEFEVSGPNTDFEVEVENIPTGTYSLVVGGVRQGDIEITEDEDGETEGEIEFRSQSTGNHELLDFDPRGETIEIFDDADTRLFFADFPGEPSDDNGQGPPDETGPPDDTGPPGDDDRGKGAMAIEVMLENVSEFDDASAEAELKIKMSKTEFAVEIEGVPAGMYALNVGGIERGIIDVVADEDGETEGEIEFEDPADDDDLPLEFDPRGQTIEILDGATVIFAGDFPE